MIELSLPAGELNVLAVGAHPDDIEIGCGGTLLRLVSERAVHSHTVVLTGTGERRAEAETAVGHFLAGAVSRQTHLFAFPDGRLPEHWGAVKSTLEELATNIRPDLVLAPRPEDAHQDHRLLAELVPTVWRNALALHYEIPKWDGDLLPVTHYVALDEDTAAQKFALLEEAYPSQTSRDWWDREMFFGLMRIRGMESRTTYAEGFRVAKAIVGL